MGTLLVCFKSMGQVSLRYKLKPGTVFQIKQQSDQTVMQRIDGLDNRVTNHIEAVLQFKVLQEQKDSYEMEIQFKDIKMKVYSNLSGEILNLDVARTEENSQNRIFKSLLDYPIKAVLKFDGNITGLRGCEQLIERMIEKADIKDDFTRDLLKTSLQNDFGPNAMSQNYKQMTYFYPARKVMVNESWHTLNKGSSETDNTWKLLALDKNKAILTANGTVNMEVFKSGMNMKLNGKQKSYLVANPYNGFLKELTIEGVAKGSSEIDMEEGKKEIPTVITSKIKYNLIN